jgi:hypothetical protein
MERDTNDRQEGPRLTPKEIKEIKSALYKCAVDLGISSEKAAATAKSAGLILARYLG